MKPLFVKMTLIVALSLFVPIAGGSFVSTPLAGESRLPPLIDGPDISEAFLEQAREYRDAGRYELARQAYAQALSTCRSNERLAVIRYEMGGVELLLRTMR
ncbi:MAG: hypothetical protein LBR31_08145 [Desulfovibrio sp.]|jgi:hypothetical protein|nr:hypothetical protein [Desulfovibrio sp.]